jgi:predicted TPR repeat methyltransferase
MRRPFCSSGDLIADRRYAYGAELAQAGDFSAAAELFKQATARAPRWTPAWHALARARLDAFDRPGAIAAFRECLKLDHDDVLGASLDLARLDAAVTIDAAPAAYVAALFDSYAPKFETALVERLQYTAPTTIAALVREAAPSASPRRFARALDLGCGTGLAGEALRLDVAYLEGVDLAAGMIAVAAEKGVYDSLVKADLLSHLLASTEKFDLIIAADVFICIGDLSRVMKALAARLSPGGLVAFSIEKSDREDWTIGESLRFAHSAGYVRLLAAASSLSVVALVETTLRKDRGGDVAGYVVLLRMPAQPTIAPCDAAAADAPGASLATPLH